MFFIGSSTLRSYAESVLAAIWFIMISPNFAQEDMRKVTKRYSHGDKSADFCSEGLNPAVWSVAFWDTRQSIDVEETDPGFYNSFLDQCERARDCGGIMTWLPRDVDCAQGGCYVDITYGCLKYDSDYIMDDCPATQNRLCPGDSVIKLMTESSDLPNCFRISACGNKAYNRMTFESIRSGCDGRSSCVRLRIFPRTQPCEIRPDMAPLLVKYQCLPVQKYQSISGCKQQDFNKTWCGESGTIVTENVLFGTKCQRGCFDASDNDVYLKFIESAKLAGVKAHCGGKASCGDVAIFDQAHWETPRFCPDRSNFAKIYYTCQYDSRPLILKTVIPVVALVVLVVICVIIRYTFRGRCPHISCQGCSVYIEWSVNTSTLPPTPSRIIEHPSFTQDDYEFNENIPASTLAHPKKTASEADDFYASVGFPEGPTDRYSATPSAVKNKGPSVSGPSLKGTKKPGRKNAIVAESKRTTRGAPSPDDHRNVSPSADPSASKDRATRTDGHRRGSDRKPKAVKISRGETGPGNRSPKSDKVKSAPSPTKPPVGVRFADVDAHGELQDIDEELGMYDVVASEQAVTPMPEGDKLSIKLMYALQQHGIPLKPNVASKPKSVKSHQKRDGVQSRPETHAKSKPEEPVLYEPEETYEDVSLEAAATSSKASTSEPGVDRQNRLEHVRFKPGILSAKPTRSSEALSPMSASKHATRQYPRSMGSFSPKSGQRFGQSHQPCHLTDFRNTAAYSPRSPRCFDEFQPRQDSAGSPQSHRRPTQPQKHRSPKGKARGLKPVESGVDPEHCYDQISPGPEKKVENMPEAYDALLY